MPLLPRVLLAALLAAVTSTVLLVPPGSARSTATTPVYHLSDSGRTVNVRKGSYLKIDLRASTGTAYRWVITQGRNSSIFTVVSRKTYAYPHSPGTTGYPYHTVYTLKAVARGTGTFRAALRSSVDSSVARRFRLYVHVTR